MFNFKKTLVLFLCAAMLIGAAMPAFAFDKNVYNQTTITSLGIKVTCSGHAYDSPDSRSTILLTFIPNVPHQAPEEYTCSTDMILFQIDARHEYNSTGTSMSQDTGVVSASVYTGGLIGAQFFYYLNNNQHYYDYKGTVW